MAMSYKEWREYTLTKCEGSVFERQIRQAVMRCVYTDTQLNKEIRPVMDLYYS